MALHGVAALKARTGPGATGDGFIVLELVIAPDKVVHRGLRARNHPQRPVQRIAGGLADLGIAGNHRRLWSGIEHRPRRHNQVQRLQTAFVQRDVAANKGAKHIQHHGPAHRKRGIIVAFVLGAGASEINRGAAGGAVNADLDADHLPLVHRIGHFALMQAVDHPAHAFLGIVLHMAHIGRHHRNAVSGANP